MTDLKVMKKKRKAEPEPSQTDKAVPEASPTKKRKQQDSEQAPVVADGNLHESNKKGRKRKRKVKLEADLPVEEQQRRQRQRDLRVSLRAEASLNAPAHQQEKFHAKSQCMEQSLALKARSEGKPYKRPPQKKRKVELTTDGPNTPHKGLQDREETGHRPTKPVEVIVIPIFWNRKPEEKEQVISAAEAIVKLIRASGLEIGIDTTNAMSPGQKFAYWESQGVKVRVECGPHDVNRGSCVLAINQKPGELAKKQKMQVDAALVNSITQCLGKETDTKMDTDEAEIGQFREKGEESRQKRVLLASGDDLGGDFEDLGVENLAIEGSAKKTKKRK